MKRSALGRGESATSPPGPGYILTMHARTACCLLAALAPPALLAQSHGPDPSADLVYAAPLMTLGRYVAPGYGVEAALTWRRTGAPCSVRVAATYVVHRFAAADGQDSLTTLPVRVLVSTGSSRLMLTGGPAVQLRRGRGAATIETRAGLAYASTTMALSGLGIDERYTRRKRYTDLAVALQAGLRLAYRVSPAVHVTGALTHTTLGPTRYGLDPVIRVGVISGPYWQPTRQWAQVLTVQLGAALGRP
jgi:hypothetical protein